MNGRNTMVLVTKRRMKSSAASGVHQSISLDGQLLEIDSLYLYYFKTLTLPLSIKK